LIFILKYIIMAKIATIKNIIIINNDVVVIFNFIIP